jgi:hypothetical protein
MPIINYIEVAGGSRRPLTNISISSQINYCTWFLFLHVGAIIVQQNKFESAHGTCMGKKGVGLRAVF